MKKRGIFGRLRGAKNKKFDEPSPTAPPSHTSSTNTCSSHHGVVESSNQYVVKEDASSGIECAIEESAPPAQEKKVLPGRLEITALNVVSTTKAANGLVMDSHDDYYSNPDNIRLLQEGGVLFSFSCPHPCSDFEQSLLNNIANLSSFKDETRENNVPHYKEGDEYTFVFSRCCYLLPGVNIQKLCNPTFLASQDYHEACQPRGTRVWNSQDSNDATTFRISKPIIPYLFDLTVQFKVSEISAESLKALSSLVNTRIDCGLLLERTKRNSQRQDSTKKAKSVLLYTKVEGGVLVNHFTVILQSSLPIIILAVINKFGQWGLAEAIETVTRTREFTLSTIPLLQENESD